MAGLAAAFNGLRTIMDRRVATNGVARVAPEPRATPSRIERQLDEKGHPKATF